MNLSNATLEPGVVTNAEDPENLGRIKCIIGGKHDPEKMNADHLPWCAPLTCFGYQRLSKPVEGQKVWVLHDSNNYYEYYYLPSWEVNSNSAVVNTEDNYDILVSRSGDGFGSQMYYNDTDGFVARTGSDVQMQLKNDGTIVSTDGSLELGIKNGMLYAGTAEGDYEPMVKGQKLTNLLNDLANKLMSTTQIASTNPYTSPLSQPLTECSSAISNAINEIVSDKCMTN